MPDTLIVYWTRFAEHKLDDIFEYYETIANTVTAQKLVTGIINNTILLEKKPQIGQKETLLKNYKIIYWIHLAKKRIEIVNVFDTRQNPIKIIESK